MSWLLLFAASTMAGPGSADWRADVQVAVEACATDRAPCDRLADLTIRVTRAGWNRIIDDRIADPALLPLLLDALLREPDPDMQVPYAEALGRLLPGADPRWGVAFAEIASTHPSAAVRRHLIQGFRRAPLQVASPGLRAALAHEDLETRSDAARVMGGHEQAASFVPDLRGSLADPSPPVRASAARALGWAGDPSVFGDLTPMLADPDPSVRLYAVMSLGKLDPARAKGVVAPLVDDPARDVARLAERLTR